MVMRNVKGLRALVVEDDRFIQAIIKANLELHGIPVIVAGNGVEAIKAFKTDEFDFVLMDIRMPEEDGLDATRWIRETEVDDQRRHIPIFALTSFKTEAHTSEIIDAGMDEHLVKPFKIEELIPLIDKYFPGALV
jgi:CheY-like chemotaxis protein